MTTDEAFALEPSEPGVVPQRVIDELVESRRVAHDYAAGFGDALKAQAEKHGVKVGALRRYVTAIATDSVEEVDAEMDDLARLLERGQE